MEMEITIRTWAVLIHNYVLAVLIVLLQYAIMSFQHTIEVERPTPLKFKIIMPYQLNLAMSQVMYDW